MPVEDKLRSFKLFSAVPDQRLSNVAKEATLQRFERHDLIWHEGDSSRFLYMIYEGRVKLIKHSETGKDVIIEIFGPPDAIGEMTLLVGGNYTTTAICLAPTTLVAIPKNIIVELLAETPDMSLRFMRGMATRSRMLMQKIKELAAGGVEYRIAHLLLKLAERLGEDTGDQISIPVVLSRQDIADLVGTTVETSIRVMSRWRKMGIVTNDKKGITILDSETLEDLASGITSHV